MGEVTFRVNGVWHSVGCDVTSDTTLLDFLRKRLELRGTKYNCLEAGCGACIVSAVQRPGEAPKGVNACMVSITSCQDWDIETIEKIGNRLDGYHPLQTTLAENNGSQCGYCSPGMIMNMYSLLKSKKLTMLEIEKSLGSNICRCTGYRPILDAFKKFAIDAPPPSLSDIEELKLCDNNGCSEQNCENNCEQSGWCMVSKNEVLGESLHIKLKDNRYWYRVNRLSDVFDIWRKNGVDSYMLVAGNTAKGAKPILEYPRLLIDISHVQELKGYVLDQNLIVGAGNTLADVLDIFKRVAAINDGFKYLEVLRKHIKLVAHTTVRNLATIAGNLMLRNRYPDFKSDIFLLLETVGGQVTVVTDKRRQTRTMQAFLREDMTRKILLNIILPPLSDEHKIVTYKIMPRSQSVHALVHAGFFYRFSKSNTVRECRIVYGALSPQFIRALNTERYLVGKKCFTNETLKGALDVLNKELLVTENLPEPPVQYRRQVALGLFYKSLLTLCPENILNDRYRSGAINLRDTRPVSEGRQEFETDPAIWPLNKPIPKIDALVQCAGEAHYTDDLPSLPGEVFVAFVLAKVPLATVKKIDPYKALKVPGVIAFYSAADIPGVNSFIPAPNTLNLADEELFCNGKVKYYDQPLGVIVAESQALAEQATCLVHVEYEDPRKPIIDINTAKKDPTRVTPFLTVEATNRGAEVVKILKGNDTVYGQYHFSMETLATVVHPTEEGLEIYAATQSTDWVQQATSRVLKLDQSRIDVIVRRLGGAYGLKVTRTSQVAVAAALVSYKLNRPCRFITSIDVNMKAIGKRLPNSRDFEVGVNAKGEIQYVVSDIYGDNGCFVNEPLLLLGLEVYNNCYKKDLWKWTAYNVVTDMASNTWCRSPGTLENIAMAEILLERIAYELDLDPLEVRLVNVDTEKHSDIIKMTETLKGYTQYTERKAAVETFNKNNRWKKRGLRFSFLKWTPTSFLNITTTVTVYADDGTVVITHGGIEMGQGVNSKAVQICAHLLDVPVEKIQVKATHTLTSPNNTVSGGSLTSQTVAIGVKRCCEKLLEKLAPVRSELDNATWFDLIRKAYALQIDLQVRDYTTELDMQNFDIHGVALAEVEIDVLTGEHEILSVDIIEDAGRSINPELDVGQIEGAFMMGMGYWTCENLVYDPKTGECLTHRPWDYWVPQALDIPQKLNVYLEKGSYSNDLILGAKMTGEPPMCLSVVVPLALRAAISAARVESGMPSTEWFPIDGPYTIDKICTSTATKLDEFRFN